MTISPTRPADAGVVHPAQPATESRAGFYRHDLDGLRGIAIALVAMFHVWFGRVSGGVDVFLALSGFFFGGKLLRAALNPASSLSPVPEVIRLVRRLLPALVVVLAGVRCADHPDPAGDAVGDLRRPEPGQPRLLPELGAGQHGRRLPAGRRIGQPAAAHLVDVGAGPVLHRVPGAGFRLRVPVSAPAGRSAADGVRGVAQRAGHRVVRLRDLRPSGQPGGGLLQQLCPGVGVDPRGPGRRAGPLRPVADVVADHRRDDRPGGGAVLRRADRRRPAIPRPVDAGARRRGRAVHPGRRQPRRRRRVAAAQPADGDATAGTTRRDGLLAVSVALAAADLLARLHRPRARQRRRGHRGAAGLRRAGVSDQPLHRRTAAATQIRSTPLARRTVGGALADPAAPPDDGARIGRRVDGRDADRDGIHLARARQRRARQRQGTHRPEFHATTPARGR